MTDPGILQTYPEYLALLAAIVASPAEDTPRLAMADYLQERGALARAQLIRHQIRLGQIEAILAGNPNELSAADLATRVEAKVISRELAAITKGGAIIEAWTSGPWWSDSPRHIPSGTFPEVAVIDSKYSNTFRPEPRLWFTFRRGFASELKLSFVVWEDYREQLCAICPLECVTLDVNPWDELTKIARSAIDLPKLIVRGGQTFLLENALEHCGFTGSVTYISQHNNTWTQAVAPGVSGYDVIMGGNVGPQEQIGCTFEATFDGDSWYSTAKVNYLDGVVSPREVAYMTRRSRWYVPARGFRFIRVRTEEDEAQPEFVFIPRVLPLV